MRRTAILLLAALVLGCSQPTVTTLAGPAAVKAAQNLPPESWPKVTAPKIAGEQAFAHVKALVAMGPRPSGSPAHKRMQDYIVSRLAGAPIEDDRFDQKTPAGNLPMRNIIAKYPGTKEGVIVLASHYDTKKLPNFVGANDGGSSAGLLLAMGEQLRANMKDGKREGLSVWLVFLDGEEALGENITETDGLYGSWHLARKWKADGTASQIKAFILADMIGDRDLQILRDTLSSYWLVELVLESATRLGYQSHFYAQQGGIIDDHIPFRTEGMEAVDLIDFDYGYKNAFWHTKEDRLDKVSPRSLEIVGNVILQAVWMLDAKSAEVRVKVQSDLR